MSTVWVRIVLWVIGIAMTYIPLNAAAEKWARTSKLSWQWFGAFVVAYTLAATGFAFLKAAGL